MGRRGYPRTPMVTHGRIWGPLGARGRPWLPVGLYGHPWTPMVTELAMPEPVSLSKRVHSSPPDAGAGRGRARTLTPKDVCPFPGTGTSLPEEGFLLGRAHSFRV